jgi:hypothetical protein
MNPHNLSKDEILRVFTPQTELEKALFKICEEFQSEVIDLQDQLKPDLSCDGCINYRDAIRSAIDELDGGDQKQALSILEDSI